MKSAVIAGVPRIDHDAIVDFVRRATEHVDACDEAGASTLASRLLDDAVTNLRQLLAEYAELAAQCTSAPEEGLPMALRYKKTTAHVIDNRYIDRYDAKIGPFFVGAQDNGEGWWNWWVALAEQGPAAGDHAIYESGGSASWDKAQAAIAKILRKVAADIQKAAA